ncbi:MAG: ATP-grasp domain-containing protein [Gallionellaceae bacterium]|nr:ATP-grasp domain-containing protein [Gallionellaceae bacterium]
MRIFVFEYVTGGGYADQPLSGLLGDGEAMWQALVDDLIALDEVEVISMRDSRLVMPQRPRLEVVATNAERFAADFRQCLAAADAVWPIAPECDGILERLSRDILAAGKRLLGCHPDAVRVAASKHATLQHLAASGVRVARTYSSPFLMSADRPLVAKPDDGAGCQDTFHFECLHAAEAWVLANGGKNFAFQYYLAGESISLSILCCDGQAQLLSVNRQQVSLEDGRFRFRGVTVNAMADPDGRYQALARCIAEALPDLWGYVGIDLVAAADGPRVLEINPRLTLSYAGLHAAMASNPAQRVLALPEFTPCHALVPVTLAETCAPSPERIAA